MSDPIDTNQLLREIRDLLAERDQQYKDHLANVENAYANQLNSTTQRARRWAIVQWVAMFFIVFGAVYLALLCANLT